MEKETRVRDSLLRVHARNVRCAVYYAGAEDENAIKCSVGVRNVVIMLYAIHAFQIICAIDVVQRV